MSEDIASTCAYKLNTCLVKHEDQPWYFVREISSAKQKGPAQGKTMHINKKCSTIQKYGDLTQRDNLRQLQTDIEYSFDPTEYKVKIAEKDFYLLPSPHDNSKEEREVRNETGYLMNLSKQDDVDADGDDNNFDSPSEGRAQNVDKVADLPLKLESMNKGSKMKKSVSLSCTGAGGMEAAMQSPKKKNNNKKRKKNKGKQPQDGKSHDSIFFLDLNLFKVKQWTAGTNHNPKKCLNYHDFKRDRRRPMGSYSSEFCLSMTKTGECSNGDSCKRAHNRVEEFYHPEKYKVKFCSTYPNDVESWEYGNFCSFAHHVDEIMIDLLDEMEKDDDFYIFHFKTVWCPYTEKKHARDEWVFAHNWQDFRRKPQQFPYSHEQWPQWQSRTFIQVYGDGCKNEFLWPFSHGWKEQEYHPKNYKINAWRNDSQWTKAHWPYFHSDSQKRSQIPEGFKLQPKNRGWAFGTNEYLADFIQNQAPILLPKRSHIYHPSTAPFVNSDTFMKQPYYIIHASLGYKDQIQYSYYLSGHAEDQLEFKQRQTVDKNQEKLPRTFSHNSQMNAISSVPFYPSKKIVPSNVYVIPTNKDISKRFPTSYSHGALSGMTGQISQNTYGFPANMEKPIQSQSNLYRVHMEGIHENWNQHSYQPDMGVMTKPAYTPWPNNAPQMIPSALRTQVHNPIDINKNRQKSTEFNYNYGPKLITETEDKYGAGYMDGDSDSDDKEGDFFSHFPTKSDPFRNFTSTELNNVKEREESKD